MELLLKTRLSSQSKLDARSIRSVRRDFSRELASEAPARIRQFANRLLEEHDPVLRLVAYELVHYHKPALGSLDEASLEQLGQGIDGWAAVDTFACYLAGPAWRSRQVSDQLIKRWAHSRDRWWRRAAAVSTVPLNNKTRGGFGDPKRTLLICKILISDRDEMVDKALSWALRELAKRDKKAVRQFLKENQDQLSARIKREVNNKLRTGLKNPKSQPRSAKGK